MEDTNVNGLTTLKGFGTDKDGRVTATFKGATGITQMTVVVGDKWREFDIGAQYIVEAYIIQPQMSFDGTGQGTFEYETEEVEDGDPLLPEPE